MRLVATLGRLLLAAALAGQVIAQQQNQPSPSSTATGATATPTGNNNNNNGNNNSSSNAASSSTSLPSGARVVQTTVTNVVNGPNGSPSQTATFVLTLTLDAAGNNAGGGQNVSLGGGNGTIGLNGTGNNATLNGTAVVWNDTLGYIPFTPHLDAAFGMGGALLILTGIPVATLGGKNRWSALAIVSGYSVGTFCLVFILSFGVVPALAPPSPTAPSAALRGLYLLAVGVSTIIGAALGVFFYTFARYWVGAAGGFSFGWFLLALKKGGLLTDVGPRWGLLGGFTVLSLLAAMTPRLHEFVILGSSAWVGATAFTLGVDCFTRAGLKEFYIYNLGYPKLFPSLNGGKYPLTQNMQVELGVIAAAALIAGAIQFKLLNVLKKRRKQIQEEEEARIEADEIARAAEQFKNVGAELARWEGKHGEGGGTAADFDTPASETKTLLYSPALPKLGFDGHGTGASHSTLVSSAGHKEVLASDSDNTHKSNSSTRRLSLLEELGFDTPHETHADPEAAAAARPPRSPTSPTVTPPVDTDLEQKLALLAEVRRARQSIRSSMDQLRSVTPTGETHHERVASTASSHVLDGTTRSRKNSTTSNRLLDGAIVVGPRPTSVASSKLLDGDRPRSRFDSNGSSQMLDGGVMNRARHDSIASSNLLLDDVTGHTRQQSATSAHLLATSFDEPRMRRDSLGPRTFAPADSDPRPSLSAREPRMSLSERPRPLSDWEQYLAERDVVVPPPATAAPEPTSPTGPPGLTRRNTDFAVISQGVAQAMSKREPVTGSLDRRGEMSPGREYGAQLNASLQRSLSTGQAPIAAKVDRRPSVDKAPKARAMTNDEFAERHRQKLAQMQDRATGPIREEIAIAEAKEKYTAQQKAEREEQRRRERERAERKAQAPEKKEAKVKVAVPAAASPGLEQLVDGTGPRAAERARRTDEWRRSVQATSPVTSPVTSPITSPVKQNVALRPAAPTRRSTADGARGDTAGAGRPSLDRRGSMDPLRGNTGNGGTNGRRSRGGDRVVNAS